MRIPTFIAVVLVSGILSACAGAQSRAPEVRAAESRDPNIFFFTEVGQETGNPGDMVLRAGFDRSIDIRIGTLLTGGIPAIHSGGRDFGWYEIVGDPEFMIAKPCMPKGKECAPAANMVQFRFQVAKNKRELGKEAIEVERAREEIFGRFRKHMPDLKIMYCPQTSDRCTSVAY